MAGLTSSGNIIVRDCRFSNPTKQIAIFVKKTLSYNIDNNKITDSAGDGIYIMYSGNTVASSAIRKVSNNIIYNCAGSGLVMYASTGDVLLNKIFNNDRIGVKLLNNCNIRNFKGRCSAISSENTQFIHDNGSYEVYLTSNCAPQGMHYNLISDDDNTPFIYYDGNVAFGEPVPPISSMSVIDVTRNTWGNGFAPSTHLYSNTSSVTYSYLPYWAMGTCFDDWTDAEQLIATADSLCELGEYATANNAYRQVVNRHPHTQSAATALKSLLSLEKEMEQDFAALQQYYLTDSAIMSDTILCKLASALSNKCDEIMGNYADAIAWYEGAITNPNTTYCDSVFATIDLGELYLGIESGGEKAFGKLAEFKPESKAVFETQCQHALSLLPKELIDEVLPFAYFEDPYPLWTDTITSQPDGFVMDAESNVEISPVVDTFVIYPNPTTGQFTVEGANVAKVEVYNLVGQKVCEQQGSKVVNIDATNWHKGIYLVNIIEENGAVVTKKLVVR
jgi:parallel beta-helix repeat protein